VGIRPSEQASIARRAGNAVVDASLNFIIMSRFVSSKQTVRNFLSVWRIADGH
jgi:hypothetical protein